MPYRTWTEEELRNAVLTSKHITEVLRKLNLCDCGNRQNIQRRIKDLGIDTSHFESLRDRQRRINRFIAERIKTPIEDILIKGSTYNRCHLKTRLFNEGFKQRRCELCGQDEIWRGQKMSLILDHINGNRTDNRLENLRIACPNCNATFPTHAGKNKRDKKVRTCPMCQNECPDQTRKYCSAGCRQKASCNPRPNKRKSIRPSMEILLSEIKELGYSAVGRRYGVSDKSVRKWERSYLTRSSLGLA